MPGEALYRNLNGWFAEYMKVNAGGVIFNVNDMDVDLRTLIEPAAVVVYAVEQAKQIFNLSMVRIFLFRITGLLVFCC